MSHAKNKVEWCLRKAEKELKESKRHRGLVRTKPDVKKVKEFISKAEHYLKATEYLKKGQYYDISATTIFFSLYHSLLAIAAKFGYKSRNQECTFALIYSLIEDGEIDFDKETLRKIASLEPKDEEETSVDIRERYQYGRNYSKDTHMINMPIRDYGMPSLTNNFFETNKIEMFSAASIGYNLLLNPEIERKTIKKINKNLPKPRKDLVDKEREEIIKSIVGTSFLDTTIFF